MNKDIIYKYIDDSMNNTRNGGYSSFGELYHRLTEMGQNEFKSIRGLVNFVIADVPMYRAGHSVPTLDNSYSRVHMYSTIHEPHPHPVLRKYKEITICSQLLRKEVVDVSEDVDTYHVINHTINSIMTDNIFYVGVLLEKLKKQNKNIFISIRSLCRYLHYLSYSTFARRVYDDTGHGRNVSVAVSNGRI